MTLKPESLKNNTPSLKDPEIKDLIQKYPTSKMKYDQSEHEDRVLWTKKLVNDLENYLSYDNAIKTTKVTDLQLKIERFNLD